MPTVKPNSACARSGMRESPCPGQILYFVSMEWSSRSMARLDGLAEAAFIGKCNALGSETTPAHTFALTHPLYPEQTSSL